MIDEVQKIDNWSEWIKREWDADTIRSIDLRVVILGSSRLLLQKGLSESLAGRFETTYLGHWSWPEMRDAFGLSISQFVWFGGYPGAAALIGDEFRWRTYVSNSLIEASISRDILMLTQVNKPALLKQLFELGCLFSGQILSFNKVMGQLQDAGNTTTMAHYLDLLHQAGLLSGLQKARPSALHKRASSPKFQVHNTALLSAQQPRLHQEAEGIPAEWGRWVESAVGAHLLNQAQFHGMELQYWREDNQEVDFVLRHRDRLIGLEVKSGNHSRRSGLQAFDKECQPHKTYLIGTGGLPWATLLEMDIRELF